MTRTRLAPLEVEMDSSAIFVDGGWSPRHSAGRVLSINTATEEAIGHAPDGDADDVDVAVRAARAALDRPQWAATTPADRATYLYRMADRIEERAQEMGAFLTTENGIPIAITP